jgi:HSP20 family protein
MHMTLSAMEDKQHSMAKEMGRWVDQVLKGYHKYCPGETWMPPINLYEDELHYTIVADLAGINAHEVDLQLEGTSLVLSGHRGTPQTRNAAGPVKLHLMEIDHGRFCRTIDVPGNVNVDGIQASYKNGYLWVRLPKMGR